MVGCGHGCGCGCGCGRYSLSLFFVVVFTSLEVEKVLGIHCLAMRAGITWQGDPPAPCTFVAVEDTDGDRQGKGGVPSIGARESVFGFLFLNGW